MMNFISFRRKFELPQATELYSSKDDAYTVAGKVQYYNACMRYEKYLKKHWFVDSLGMSRKPPEMTWLMDEAGREKELGRWKKNEWFTETNASDYGNGKKSDYITYSLGEPVIVEK